MSKKDKKVVEETTPLVEKPKQEISMVSCSKHWGAQKRSAFDKKIRRK